MKITVAVIGVSMLANTSFAQTKSKTPAQSSAEATSEAPSEQGMEDDEDATEPATPDQSSKASGIGLDGNTQRKKKGTVEETNPKYKSEDLDEAADDILNESFSQPGYDQDTGHTDKNKTGTADVAVPAVTAPLPSVKLEKKPAYNKEDAAKAEKVVIKDKQVIFKIQKALVKHGAKLTPDGILGAATVEALKEFQDINDLKPDGNPTPATLTKLGIIYIGK
jgi:hypothetical protein